MYTKWTSHLSNEQDKKSFEQAILGANSVLLRLKTILEEDINKIEKSETDYDTPNWDYRQAHHNGYRQCLQNIIKLITVDQQKESRKHDRKLI